ncbi:hypothetical protein OM190_24855, partial [Escherichia albertii]|nr:hypothetical protein [Escherichia albertii]MCZ8989354.1 hypothetical protein [Escherichia albertii]MCZ8998624.1 hypothetical protein [Escherichia albertii]MCZ9027334.1 hypothetical protein [Escherichia albertii]MCZ9046226.1 hypothetical protein [Escherichia albertii]
MSELLFANFFTGRLFMHSHHHQISMIPLTMSSPIKGFSLYVESEDMAVAIAELENALSQLKNGDKA